MRSWTFLLFVVLFSFISQSLIGMSKAEQKFDKANHGKSYNCIDSMCLFDTLYVVYRQIYPYLDERLRHKESANAESQFATTFVDMLPMDWYIDVPSLTNRGSAGYSRPSVRFYENIRDSVQAVLLPAVEAVTGREGYSAETEKARMVRELEAFGDTALTLPTIYALIATKYGGDVRAYVDDLFDGSVMTSRRRLRRFVKGPSVQRMREDMGFQFVVSKLMYRLWEAQGRPAQPAADGTRLVVLRSELEKR